MKFLKDFLEDFTLRGKAFHANPRGGGRILMKILSAGQEFSGNSTRRDKDFDENPIPRGKDLMKFHSAGHGFPCIISERWLGSGLWEPQRPEPCQRSEIMQGILASARRLCEGIRVPPSGISSKSFPCGIEFHQNPCPTEWNSIKILPPPSGFPSKFLSRRVDFQENSCLAE